MLATILDDISNAIGERLPLVPDADARRLRPDPPAPHRPRRDHDPGEPEPVEARGRGWSEAPITASLRLVTHDDADRPIEERTPDEVARLIEAIRPTREEDERAERFAMRLLETPATPETIPSSRDQAVAAEAHSRRRDVMIVALGAAVGLVVGIIATLVVTGGA